MQRCKLQGTMTIAGVNASPGKRMLALLELGTQHTSNGDRCAAVGLNVCLRHVA
jgi:hypothetical protein